MQSIDGQSIEQRLRARIEAKQGHRTVTLPVDGYEDLFTARYRALTYREMKRIGRQNMGVADEDEREMYVAADILAIACEEVFEVPAGGGDPVSLGSGWSPALAGRLGLPHCDTGRQCVLAVFADDLDLVAHRDAYIEWRDRAVVETANEVVGNSGA